MSTPTFSAAQREFEPARRSRCLVIGEVAQAHDGSLGLAHAFIDAIAHAGADAVKFQTHIAAAESTPAEPWRVRFSRRTRPATTTGGGWSSPRSSGAGSSGTPKSAGCCFSARRSRWRRWTCSSGFGIGAWKVASGEVGNIPLLDRMLETGKPILLSTGMSPIAELDAAVARVKSGVGRRWRFCSARRRIRARRRRSALNLIPVSASATAARSASRITPARSIPVWPPPRLAWRSSRCT